MENPNWKLKTTHSFLETWLIRNWAVVVLVHRDSEAKLAHGKQLKNCTFIDFSCSRLLTEHNLSEPEQIGFWISCSLITLAYSPKCVSFKVIDACFGKILKFPV